MALVDDAGNVQNVILIDDEKQNYQPPEGCELVEATGHAEPGGTYSKGNFTRARIAERRQGAGRSRRPFDAHRIEAYGVLVSTDVGDSALGWFTVTSTPFWSD